MDEYNSIRRKGFALIAGLGCTSLVFLVLGAMAFLLFFFPMQSQISAQQVEPGPTFTPVPGAQATQDVVPTFTVAPEEAETFPAEQALPQQIGSVSLAGLYQQINPGVVNIQVYVERQGMTGQGGGSGFILDNEGHIITNNHVVAAAEQITVIFHNNFEAEAELIGTDANSDLAIIQVEELPAGVHPLNLGNSDQAAVGEWVMAIGNPFGQQSSMSVGIVSAVGRTIPSGATPFGIPQAIQTDAAINPGNSGGPLLNLQGQVIGVNAQIATTGAPGNVGVGFAIPANVVRQIAPVLIENGTYQWPWLGVEGASVNLLLAGANDFDTQQGAYIDEVVPDGPADEAGLQGSSDTVKINGFDVPVGGDVVIAADGEPVADFNDLLARIIFKDPDDTMDLTILRDGQREEITIQLRPRPDDFDEPVKTDGFWRKK